MSTDYKRQQRLKELAEKRKRLDEMRRKKKEGLVGKKPQKEEEPKPEESIDKLKEVSTVDDLLGALETDIGKKVEEKEPVTKEEEKSTAPKIERQRPKLTIQDGLGDFDVTPKRIETYSKGVQTASAGDSPPEDVFEYRAADDEEEDELGDVSQSILSEVREERKDERLDERMSSRGIASINDNEKQMILSSKDAASFVGDAATSLERAMYVNNNIDVLSAFMTDEGEGLGWQEGEVKLQIRMSDERWTKNRAVNSINWSPKYPELVLASYSERQSGALATGDADGVVLVWHMDNVLDRPEFVYTCQSPVLCAEFSKFESSIVVGGTYSGQVVLWDSRAKATPVQQSPLSSHCHTHPVYGMRIVGTPNAHNLITLSTDGRLCAWTMDNLTQPIETLQLQNALGKSSSAAIPIAPTCLSFPESQVNQFCVGTEEGVAYMANRHGATQGVRERFEGHFGPITGLDFHSAKGPLDQSDLFLTSSVDWSVKLWSTKYPGKPVHCFEESADYVYDIKWSPTHPAVFASADGEGELSLWNMNMEMDVPVIREKVSDRSLNRISWSTDGRRIAAGDSAGVLSIYDCGQMGTPQPEDFSRFEENVRSSTLAAITPQTSSSNLSSGGGR